MLFCLLKMAEKFSVQYKIPLFENSCPFSITDGLIFAMNESDAEKFLAFYQIMINHLVDIHLTYINSIPGYKAIPLLFVLMACDDEIVIEQCLTKYNSTDIKLLYAIENNDDQLNILQFVVKHGYIVSIVILLDILYSSTTTTSSETIKSEQPQFNVLCTANPYNVLHLSILYDQIEACEVLCDHLDVDTLIALFQQSKFQSFLNSTTLYKFIELLLLKMNSILELTRIHHSLRLRKRQVQQIVEQLTRNYERLKHMNPTSTNSFNHGNIVMDESSNSSTGSTNSSEQNNSINTSDEQDQSIQKVVE